MSRDCLCHVADEFRLAGFVEIILVLGVGVAVPNNFVTASAERRDHFRAMLVNFRVQKQRDRQIKTVEQFNEPPNTNAITVLTPAPVVRVGMRNPGRIGDAEKEGWKELTPCR